LKCSSERALTAVRVQWIPLAVVLLGSGLAACGGAGKGGGPASQVSPSATARGTATGATSSGQTPRAVLAAPPSGDTDHDSSEQTTFDSDDGHSLHFGHAAGPADRRTITAIVKRYYAALAAQDGVTACALLMAVVAESLPEAIYGPSALTHTSGKTCAEVASALFAESHPQLVAEDRTLRVIGVRVRRRRASALLRFGARSARHILLYREGGAWKIGTLADEDLG
jgi:hypothetical protein